jgi:hypothetical protein
MEPPNGLAFSCRERAGSSLQNTNDLARSGRLQCRVRRPRAGAVHRISLSWLRLTVTGIFGKVFLLPDMTSTSFRSTLLPASRCCSCVATRAMPLAPQAPARVIAVYRPDLSTAVPWPLLVWCGTVTAGSLILRIMHSIEDQTRGSCEEWVRHPI